MSHRGDWRGVQKILARTLAARYRVRPWKHADIEDLVQDAMIAALAADRKYKPETGVPWIKWVVSKALWAAQDAARRYSDGTRSQQKDGFVIQVLSSDVMDDFADPPVEDQRIIDFPVLHTIKQSVADLPVNWRVAWVLYNFAGMTVEEIARRMGVSRDSVYQYLYQARKRLMVDRRLDVERRTEQRRKS